jgi:glucose/arabinose dehydrogenase
MQVAQAYFFLPWSKKGMKSAVNVICMLAFVTMCIANPLLAQNQSGQPPLPQPYATKSVRNFSKVKGWKDASTPQAPAGFTVTAYSSGLDNPRWMYVLPNGDLLVAESNSNHSIWEKIGAFFIGATKSNNLHNSADRITLLRDSNNDGKVDFQSIFLKNLNQPFGMLLLNGWLYVANTDAVVRFPYTDGLSGMTNKPEKIADLPGGMRHWTRNIIANAAGTKIYVAVGSGSNVGEKGMDKEKLRADILEMDPDGKNIKIFAAGLRNPVGMAWTEDGELWTVVNERDELGDELVPDYLTHVQAGGFYGWPYMYWGLHPDPRIKEKSPEAAATIVPDFGLGPHTASLGLAIYDGSSFPEKYRQGAFIGQHGSWNRSTLSGYKVIFVPFVNNKPAGPSEDFLTGFILDLKKDKVRGRPVGVTVMPDGALMVADDVSKVLWRVSYH